MSGVSVELDMEKSEIVLPKFYHYTKYLEWGSMLSFVGCVLLLVSFSSPYWLASWQDSMSPFLNLGLWTVCFNKFRHPHVQFDKLYDGCYSMWGDELRMISYWISPGWMIAIQVSSTCALVVSLLSQVSSACLVLRSPRSVVLRFERSMIIIAASCDGFSGLIMLVNGLVFCLSCWSRDWLLYPNYNYLSWSFALAIGSVLSFLFSVVCHVKESKYARDREVKNLNILYKLHPELNPSLGSLDIHSVSGTFL